MSRPVTVFALIALVLFTHLGSLKADEVRWRSDYNAARQESVKSGRPLLLDFGTEACIWCKRLDASTFRAPAVVERLNSQYIPVKVNAERMMPLVEALGIQSYPTLIIAAPSGQILGRQEGYVEAAGMARLLDQSFAKLPRPQTVVPVSATVSAPPVVAAAAPASMDPAREEISRKLTQVYLDRGLELCRAGRLAEGQEYFALAASLCPQTPEAATARDLVRRLKTGEEMPRP